MSVYVVCVCVWLPLMWRVVCVVGEPKRRAVISKGAPEMDFLH